MKKKNSDYWKSRMEALENEQYRRSAAYYKDVQEQFRIASSSIQLDIEQWYRRLADNNGISYASAKRFLRSSELEEFKWTVEQYIKAGKENDINQRWMKELENASAKHHISYLEAMKLQIQQHAVVLSAQYEGATTEFLRETFADQYYGTAWEVSQGTGAGVNLARLDTRKIDAFIKHPWGQDGKNFSDRIWANKEKLVNTLHNELAQAITRGAPIRQAIDNLAKTMDVSKSQAGCLIMTESAAISSAAEKECYKELGVKKYEYDATLDSVTCDVCGEMDEQVFDTSDYVIGVTAPPIHPRCRCCTAPYFDDWKEYGIDPQRAARDPETDKTVYVDGNMQYKTWKKQFLNKTPDDVVNLVKSGIMVLPKCAEAVIPEAKFNQYALNPEKDPNKARAFEEALGYNQSNYTDLIENIREHLPDFEAVEKPDNGHGKRYEVVMELTGPNGKKASVLTAWIDDAENGEMRLTTAHVDRRRKKSGNKNV